MYNTNHTMDKAEFSRSCPLFERTHVPFQVLFLPSSKNMTHTNGSVDEMKRCSDSIECFTMRVLDGRRPTPGNENNIERVIRIEISDESTKYEVCHNLESKSVSCREYNTMPTSLYSNDKQRANIQGNKSQSSLFASFNNENMRGSTRNHMNLHIRKQPYDERRNWENSGSNSSISIIGNSPIVLYELEVGESDFTALRQDQALLVDFSEFAQSFIKLLKLCNLGTTNNENCLTESEDIEYDHYESNHRFHHSKPNPLFGSQLISDSKKLNVTTNSRIFGETTKKSASVVSNQPLHNKSHHDHDDVPCNSNYKCRIEHIETMSNSNTGGNCNWNKHKNAKNIQFSRFSIVESNQFRELTHLALNLQKGTDASIRSYLSKRLSQSLGEIDILNMNLETACRRVTMTDKALSEAADKLKAAKILHDTEREKIKVDYEALLQKQYEQQNVDVSNINEKKEEEIESVKSSTRGSLLKFQEKINVLENEKILSKDTILKLEQENVRFKENVKKNEGSIDLLTKELASANEEFRNVQKEKIKSEKELHESQISIDKLKHCNESQRMSLEEITNRLKCSEESVEKLRTSLENESAKLNAANNELCKLNVENKSEKTLLRKYQLDRQEMKKRMKSKAEMIRRQEEILTCKDQEISDLQSKMEIVYDDAQKLQQNLDIKQKEAMDAKKNEEEYKRIIESNQQVIRWLNKEINSSKPNTLTPSKVQVEYPTSFKGPSSYGRGFLQVNPVVTNPLSQQKINNIEYRDASKDTRYNFQV